MIEELPTPVRAVLLRAEEVESEQRNLLAEDGLSGSQKTICEPLNVEEPRPVDDLVETSGLNSSLVLATLIDLGMKGNGAADLRKAVQQSAVVNAGVSAPQTEECTQRAVASIISKRKRAAGRRYIR